MSELSVQLSVYIKKVIADEFTPHDLHECIVAIITYLSSSGISEFDKLESYVNISSFLTSLKVKNIDIQAEYIASAAEAILKFSNRVDSTKLKNTAGKQADGAKEDIIADIVGTGGDGQNTFNVSTSAAIVVAGIPGIKIIKHGGKASTSTSGAGDLINNLGIDSTKVHASNVETYLFSQNDFMFLLASQFHTGMFHIAEIRKLMKIPTIFNVLGPLLHPVELVNKRILGVYSDKLGEQYAKAAKLIYPNSDIMVVFGECGLDELSPIGNTKIWKVSKNSQDIEILTLNPSNFDIKEYPLDQCKSMSPKENAEFLENQILKGTFNKGENAIYDYILLNSALLYCLCIDSSDYKSAVQVVEKSIHSGSALEALHKFVSSVQDL